MKIVFLVSEYKGEDETLVGEEPKAPSHRPGPEERQTYKFLKETGVTTGRIGSPPERKVRSADTERSGESVGEGRVFTLLDLRPVLGGRQSFGKPVVG